MNMDFRQRKQELHKLHIRAKHTGDIRDWTHYKNTKATLNRETNNQKTKHINNELNNSHDILKTLKEINNTKGTTIPRNRIHDNKIHDNY